MSGAVRGVSINWQCAEGFCVGWIDISGSVGGCAENVPPDHYRVEHEAERKIEDDADDHGSDVVPKSAFGNRRSRRIAAVLDGDTIIDGPRQHRSEQDDAAEIAIDRKMRHRPGL